jgi:curli biogenesis system outer membrane secretion channel CsgG
MGSSLRLGGWFAAVVPLVCAAALTGPAALLDAAAAKTPKSNSKTFILPAHTTKTFQVGYPFALKFKGAKYSCRATVSGLGKGYVKILSRGSALGGTVCRVKARNNAMLPSLDTTANLEVIATTTL